MDDAQPKLPLSTFPFTRGWKLRHVDGLVYLHVAGQPTFAWAEGDVVGRDVAACSLHLAGFASLPECARFFDCDLSTLYRSWRRFKAGGPAAVARKVPGYEAGTRFDAAEESAIRRYFNEGMTYREIARAATCSFAHVGDVVRRLGLNNPTEQAALPMIPEASETLSAELPSQDAPIEDDQPEVARDPEMVPTESPAIPVTWDTDPSYRTVDRSLAHAGRLHDAAPFFADGNDLPCVGALLAVPGIVQSGLIEEGTRLYPNFGPAFYGIRTTLMSSILLFLLRIPRAENLKEWQPADLGRILGLDRVPEIGTMRGKLRRLADGEPEALAAALVQRRLANSLGDPMAWLYVDGHVRVYSGKRKLPATHVTQMRTCLPAVQDLWVNDEVGAPVLVVTLEAHPSLAQKLESILEEVAQVVGKRKATVIFDRGGWSPAVFSRLVDQGYGVITYRKGEGPELVGEQWETVPAPDGDGTWDLSDVCLLVGAEKVRMRQVTLRQDAHRTEILTTEMDPPAVEIAERMFRRWRQENFFKYMRDEFDIDGLVEYGEVPDDPGRELPNPAWRKLNNRLKKAKGKLGQALAKGQDGAAIRLELQELTAQRDSEKPRIQVREMEKPTVRLPIRRQNLVAALKIVAWHVETGLVSAVGPHWKRNEDEGRTLISAALRSKGSIAVENGELRVTLGAQSVPERTRAIGGLCRVLDDTRTIFPGTALTMRFAVDHATGWGAGRTAIP